LHHRLIPPKKEQECYSSKYYAQ
ncbi:conserved hypothetical protein, partial [Trichinella spiralis]